MATLSTGKGLFKLSDSDNNVGSFFSISDVYEILEIDKISKDEFCVALQNIGVLYKKNQNLVDEKDLYKKYKDLKNLYSTHKVLHNASLDEYVLKQIIYRALPGGKVLQQFPVLVGGSKRPIKVDFKIEYNGVTKILEFDGPGHYSPNYGNNINDSRDRKKRIEDALGCECVIWPYWIQRSETNAKILFDDSLDGFGALWSTNVFFGDFLIQNPSEVIIAETKRFNAVKDDGVGYFYGTDSEDCRNIVSHSIIDKIIKGKACIDKIIPNDWKGDKRFWLPKILWEFV